MTHAKQLAAIADGMRRRETYRDGRWTVEYRPRQSIQVTRDLEDDLILASKSADDAWHRSAAIAQKYQSASYRLFRAVRRILYGSQVPEQAAVFGDLEAPIGTQGRRG